MESREGLGRLQRWAMWRGLFVTLIIFFGLSLLPSEPGEAQTPVCPAANGTNRFGVNEVLGWPGLYPPNRLEMSLGLMAEAGMGWARTNWAWKDLESQKGSFDYTHLDDVARTAGEHHLQ